MKLFVLLGFRGFRGCSGMGLACLANLAEAGCWGEVSRSSCEC